MTDTKPLWVFDIDGVVANCDHRLPLVSQRHLFMSEELLMKDTPYRETQLFFHNGIFRHGQHMFLSSRDGICAETTKRWLAAAGFATDTTPIYLRPEGETRKSHYFKAEMLEKIMSVSEDRQIIFVDDRDRTIEEVSNSTILWQVVAVHAKQLQGVLRAWGVASTNIHQILESL